MPTPVVESGYGSGRGEGLRENSKEESLGSGDQALYFSTLSIVCTAKREPVLELAYNSEVLVTTVDADMVLIPVVRQIWVGPIQITSRSVNESFISPQSVGMYSVY